MSTGSSRPSPPLAATPSPTDTTPTTASGRTSDNLREPKESNLDGIPRSASYTQLPATTPPDASFERNGIKRTFSENVIANSKANTFRHASIQDAPQREQVFLEPDSYADGTSDISIGSKDEPKITISKFALATDEDGIELTYDPNYKKKARDGDQTRKVQSVTGSISRFARQSWVPSPSKRGAVERKNSTHDSILKESSSRSPAHNMDDSTGSETHGQDHSRNGTVRRTQSRRPLSSLITATPSRNITPSVPSIPKSLSTDRLPLSHAHTSTEIPPSLPKSISFERFQIVGTDSPRKRDELWSSFRALDGDFQKYRFLPQPFQLMG